MSLTVLSKDSTDDLAVLATNVGISGETEERAEEPKAKTTVFIVGFDDGHTTRDQLNSESGASFHGRSYYGCMSLPSRAGARPSGEWSVIALAPRQSERRI